MAEMNAYSGFVGPFPRHSMETIVCESQPAAAVWKQVPYPQGNQKHQAHVSPMVRLQDNGDVSVHYMKYRSGDNLELDSGRFPAWGD